MPFDATPRKVNEVSVGLRKMAEWFRANGFTPSYTQGKCGCFAKSLNEIHPVRSILWTETICALPFDCSYETLVALGYTYDPTGEKAAQLCERVAAELEL